jgi:hypothetical protein
MEKLEELGLCDNCKRLYLIKDLVKYKKGIYCYKCFIKINYEKVIRMIKTLENIGKELIDE